MSYDIIINFVVGIIWCVVGLLLVIRHMEVRGLKFNISQLEDGRGIEFSYRLGVYGGRVILERDPDVKEPVGELGLFGWVYKFPIKYTNTEMLDYVRNYAPKVMDGSHSKDLLVFNEVVLNKNHALISINGQIFVYDNHDYKPFKSK